MDKKVQVRNLAILAGALVSGLVGGVVHAQTVTATGLWSTDLRVSLNGVDSVDLMTKLQTQIISAMPTALKSQSTTTLNSTQTRGVTKVCITPSNIATISTPAAIFKTFSKMNPKCSLVQGTTTATGVSFTGRCDDPMSFTGNIRGDITLKSTLKSWVSQTVGYGKVPDSALAALKLPSGSSVRMQSWTSSYWVSKTCP